MPYPDKINQKVIYNKILQEINYRFYHITILLGFFSQQGFELSSRRDDSENTFNMTIIEYDSDAVNTRKYLPTRITTLDAACLKSCYEALDYHSIAWNIGTTEKINWKLSVLGNSKNK